MCATRPALAQAWERLEVPNWGEIGSRGGRLLPSMASYRPGSPFSVQSARSMTQKTGLQGPVPMYNILRTGVPNGARSFFQKPHLT